LFPFDFDEKTEVVLFKAFAGKKGFEVQSGHGTYPQNSRSYMQNPKAVRDDGVVWFWKEKGTLYWHSKDVLYEPHKWVCSATRPLMPRAEGAPAWKVNSKRKWLLRWFVGSSPTKAWQVSRPMTLNLSDNGESQVGAVNTVAMIFIILLVILALANIAIGMCLCKRKQVGCFKQKTG